MKSNRHWRDVDPVLVAHYLFENMLVKEVGFGLVSMLQVGLKGQGSRGSNSLEMLAVIPDVGFEVWAKNHEDEVRRHYCLEVSKNGVQS